MRIDGLDRHDDGDWTTFAAAVHWECAGRPAQRLSFTLRRSDAGGLDPVPEAFLLGALVPAYAAGEARIAMDAPVCPRLRAGLGSALAILRQWFPRECPASAPRFEIPTRSGLALPANPAATAAFYSGGVDSIHMLLANHADHPAGHPGRIARLIPVYGFDIGGRREHGDQRAAFTEFLDDSAELSGAFGVPLLPVYTDLRHLDDRPGFWGRVFCGAALAAVAHQLREHFSSVLVANQGEPLCQAVQRPFGTHPCVMAYYRSFQLDLELPYLGIGRLQRLALIAREPAVLRALRVCYTSRHGSKNCGRCEKCVRTQLGLGVHGVDPAPYFSGTRLDAELVDSITIASEPAQSFFVALLTALEARGDSRLAAAVRRRLEAYAAYCRWRDRRGFKGWVKRMLASPAPAPSACSY